MARILVFNDPHYSRTPPECRADSYAHELLDIFHTIARYSKKNEIDGIGCTGDWFHRKGRVTFHEANDLLAILSGWRRKGFAVFGILGNHDIAGHALESMDGRAVGSFVHSKVLQLLDGSPWHHEDEKNGGIVVTGTSFFHGCDANDEARIKMYGYDRARFEHAKGTLHVHLAHGALVQKGEFFDEYTNAQQLIPLLEEANALPDVIVSGHLHFSEGIKAHESPKGRTVYVARVGSTGQVARDDLERVPHALQIETHKHKLSLTEVPIGPAPNAVPQTQTEGTSRPKETEERIREFVTKLRDEADKSALMDHAKLIEGITEQLHYEQEVAKVALQAVEKRQ